MTAQSKLIKVGRQGIPMKKGSRIPASFFRHQMPGKKFVVLNAEERGLMHVRSSNLNAIQLAYQAYKNTLTQRGTTPSKRANSKGA